MEEKVPYTYGPVVMAVMKMIVLLMAVSSIYTIAVGEIGVNGVRSYFDTL